MAFTPIERGFGLLAERWSEVVNAAAGKAIELPVSTAIMLKSIADIARSEGEVFEDAEAVRRIYVAIGSDASGRRIV